METQPESETSHFLGLPAELRNSIYTYLFEDSLEQQLDLLSWKQFLPCVSIVCVNRQTRSECQTLYEEAEANLWKIHQWTFCIDARFSSKSCRESIRLQCDQVPRSAPIRRLSVVFDFPCTPYGPRPAITFDFSVAEKGLGEWKLRSPASIVSHYRTTVLENVLETSYNAILDSPLTLAEDPWSLDVRSCISPFFELFNAIPFLSALEFWEY